MRRIGRKPLGAVTLAAVLILQPSAPALGARVEHGFVARTTEPRPAEDTSLGVAGARELEARLRESPAVRELLELTLEMLQRASAADPEQLRLALETYDPVAAAEALGLSSEEERLLTARLHSLRREILLQFPELSELAQSQLMTSCVLNGSCGGEQVIPLLPDITWAMKDVVEAFERFPVGGEDPLFPQTSGQLPGSSGCYWVQYIAYLALCTLAGPVFYWPCAYLAYCSYCWGPIHDKICL